MKKKLKIGISMRVSSPENYQENRDTIAQDWSLFMQKEFKGIQWMYLPNIGDEIITYLQDWDINAFILTGGEDIGTNAERDITDREILKYAINNNYPLLGVCRGLQLMYDYFGGVIEKGGNTFVENHRAKIHAVQFKDKVFDVNSYHNNVLIENEKLNFLKIEARCVTDSSIEAISYKNMLGVMWHPERKLSQQYLINKYIKTLFNLNA